MYVIGITGGTGSGKTILSHTLEKQGVPVLDCDKIYHELLIINDTLRREIDDSFPGVLADGLIDRRKLGKIVFSNKKALQKLNGITHKYVLDEVKNRLAKLEKQGGTVAAMDAIALIESGASEMCDITVGIIAPEDSRIARIIQRDNISRGQASKRIRAQKPDSFYTENCDEVLENSYYTIEAFEKVCNTWFKKLCKQQKIKLN